MSLYTSGLEYNLSLYGPKYMELKALSTKKEILVMNRSSGFLFGESKKLSYWADSKSWFD